MLYSTPLSNLRCICNEVVVDYFVFSSVCPAVFHQQHIGPVIHGGPAAGSCTIDNDNVIAHLLFARPSVFGSVTRGAGRNGFFIGGVTSGTAG